MQSQVLWNSTRAWPLAAAVAVMAVMAVLWLYPSQVRQLRGPWRWGLPALRAAAVLALAGSLLKPSVLRPKTMDERPAVIVLVDNSRSMSVTDNARTPAQLVALAGGLGRLPREARSRPAAAVEAGLAGAAATVDEAARAHGDWEYARVSGRGVEAARRRVANAMARVVEAADRLVADVDSAADPAVRGALTALRDAAQQARGTDNAAPGPGDALRRKLADARAAAARAQAAADDRLYQTSEPVRVACRELSGLSRFQLAAHALLRPDIGLLARVGSRANVVGFTVSDGLSPLSLDSAGDAAAASPALRAAPDGRASELAGAARAAVDRVGAREVAAVVFISDGRQVGGGDTVTAGLSASGVPVFTVAAGPAGAVRDLSFAAVSLPATAFLGESITVRAEIRSLGLKAFTTDLSAAAGSDAPPVTRRVTGAQGPVRAAGEFELRIDRAGAQRITLAAKPAEGEAVVENNQVSRWVKVLSQKVKVAAYAGSPARDFQYLRSALSRTQWVDLVAGILPPADGARLPLTPQQILELDVLVLSDVPAAALDDAQWDAAYRMVSEQGGSALLVAGEAHLPAEYARRRVTANLLPYPPEVTPTWRLWPGEQPLFRLAPHWNAARTSFINLGDDPPDAGMGQETGRGASIAPRGVERWQALPGMYRFLPITGLKPSATPLLIEVASGAPVLTETRVGAGRSFLFGANETWRWRRKLGERDQDRFWVQLVRYAAGAPYAVRSQRIALDLDKVAIETGEPVRVRARVPQGPGAAAPTVGTKPEAARYHAEVVEGQAVIQSVPLATATAADPGRLEARVGPLPEGDYQVRVVEARPRFDGAPSAAAPAPAPTGVGLPLHVESTYEAELADVSPDFTILHRLAEASGGRFFALEEVDQLADRINLAAERRPRYVEQRLWDSPLLFAFVAGCLAAEWAARKRIGLA